MASLLQDFCMLKATLLDSELVLDPTLSETTRQFWESLQPDAPAEEYDVAAHLPLTFTAVLPRSSALRVDVIGVEDVRFSVTSEDRDIQSQLSATLQDSEQEAGQEDFPIFFIHSSLHAHLLSNVTSPPAEASHQLGHSTAPAPSARTSLKVKTVFLWAHHLLAQSKRKDIKHWSTELGIWTVHLVGYPGVIVAQGGADDVTEFLRRIKALQWYALQVRSEEQVEVPIDDKTDERDAEAAHCPLRLAVLHDTPEASQPISKVKPGGRELDSMSTLASLMKVAGLSGVFTASILKLPSRDETS